jgi:hypothetical protein
MNEALEKQSELAVAHRIAGGLLTFSQFVVGGLLASSFLQENLSKNIVGILGLVVLFSSLLRQHYRPDVKFRGALLRATQLKILIRQAEDYVYAAEANVSGAPSLFEIRQFLTESLNQINHSELQDFDGDGKKSDQQLSEKSRQPKLPSIQGPNPEKS